MSNDNASAPLIPALTLCEVADLGLPGHESNSPFCMKVHRALKSRGLRYQRRHAPAPAAFQAINPAGQVPILLVGDEAVFDSTRILARIDELAPGPALSPRQRAEALLWEELADTAINGFLVASRWADDRNWPAVEAALFGPMPPAVRADMAPQVRARQIQSLVARDIWRQGPEACWRRFEALLDQLDARAPAEGFWVGEALSAADFAIFGQLHSLRLPLTPWQRDQLALRATLSAYLDRVDLATRG